MPSSRQDDDFESDLCARAVDHTSRKWLSSILTAGLESLVRGVTGNKTGLIVESRQNANNTPYTPTRGEKILQHYNRQSKFVRIVWCWGNREV